MNTLKLLSEYNQCIQYNWLFESVKSQYLLGFYAFGPMLFVITESGAIGWVQPNSSSDPMASVKPTLYLSSDIFVNGGTGSKDNPYQISL